MKKVVRGTLAVAAILLFSGQNGCETERSEVSFFYPLYDSSDELFLPELVGTWEGKGRSLVFERWEDSNVLYVFSVIKGGKAHLFRARLAKLDEHLFLDYVSTDYAPIFPQVDISDYLALDPGENYLIDAFVKFLSDYYMSTAQVDTVDMMAAFIAQLDPSDFSNAIGLPIDSSDLVNSADVLYETDDWRELFYSLISPIDLIDDLIDEFPERYFSDIRRISTSHKISTMTFFTHGLMTLEPEQGGKKLKIGLPDSDWLKNQIMEDKLDLPYAVKKGGVDRYLVTAPTEVLRQFVQAHADTLFGKVSSYDRTIPF